MSAVEARERYIAAPAAGGLYDIVDTEKDLVVGIVGSKPEADEAVQRLTALLTANAKRSAVAAFKRDVKHLGPAGGARRVVWFLRGKPDGMLASMRVWDALTAVPKVGRTRATNWIGAVGVHASANRRIRDLTERQRLMLAQILEDHAEREEFVEEERRRGMVA